MGRYVFRACMCLVPVIFSFDLGSTSLFRNRKQLIASATAVKCFFYTPYDVQILDYVKRNIRHSQRLNSFKRISKQKNLNFSNSFSFIVLLLNSRRYFYCWNWDFVFVFHLFGFCLPPMRMQLHFHRVQTQKIPK